MEGPWSIIVARHATCKHVSGRKKASTRHTDRAFLRFGVGEHEAQVDTCDLRGADVQQTPPVSHTSSPLFQPLWRSWRQVDIKALEGCLVLGNGSKHPRPTYHAADSVMTKPVMRMGSSSARIENGMQAPEGWPRSSSVVYTEEVDFPFGGKLADFWLADFEMKFWY
ncbi:hypothetical protein CMUS01_08494 [Colletotrichum musicola]|uniref:Uncharacterized protein n=1 Tax=Colletotrichum musicola TaxID=2175873 RepID=A0A8H6NCV8_9PEZI|nr:hypothetical protein CMUS01_08494 [Colletotrichum musicola]